MIPVMLMVSSKLPLVTGLGAGRLCALLAGKSAYNGEEHQVSTA